MKNYYSKKSHLETKSTASYYWQKFKGFDPKLRKNIAIGVSLMMMIVVTGFLLALISLVQMGGNFAGKIWGEFRESSSRSVASLDPREILKKDVENALSHINP